MGEISRLYVYFSSLGFGTVKPVLSGHSKIDKTKILIANGSLMKVKSIAVLMNEGRKYCRMLPLEHSPIL